MAIFTLTLAARTNLPPNRIGDIQIDLDHNQLYNLTVNDFTINTIPTYQDPEGDGLEAVKVLTLPSVGTLLLNSLPVSINDEISSGDINSNLFQYQADPGTTSNYTDSNFTFDVSDTGSNSFGGLTGTVTFKVSAKVNEPPSAVGDGSAVIAYGDTLVFTRAMLTSSLVPPYSDPEGDAAGQLKITQVPTNSEIKLNGITVVNNQIIDFTDIDAGLLTAVGDLSFTVGGADTFNFQIADVGSNIFVG